MVVAVPPEAKLLFTVVTFGGQLAITIGVRGVVDVAKVPLLVLFGETLGKADELELALPDDDDADETPVEIEVVVVVVDKAVVASCADDNDNPNLASSSPGILATRNTRFLHHYRALRTWSLSLVSTPYALTNSN